MMKKIITKNKSFFYFLFILVYFIIDNIIKIILIIKNKN